MVEFDQNEVYVYENFSAFEYFILLFNHTDFSLDKERISSFIDLFFLCRSQQRSLSVVVHNE